MERVGIAADGMLSLSAIFSFGISWSMRDWLASTWAGVAIACTTDLVAGSKMIVALPLIAPVGGGTRLVQVLCLGTLFVECEVTIQVPDGPGETYKCYVPNSYLIQNGFGIVV